MIKPEWNPVKLHKIAMIYLQISIYYVYPLFLGQIVYTDISFFSYCCGFLPAVGRPCASKTTSCQVLWKGPAMWTADCGRCAALREALREVAKKRLESCCCGKLPEFEQCDVKIWWDFRWWKSIELDMRDNWTGISTIWSVCFFWAAGLGTKQTLTFADCTRVIFRFFWLVTWIFAEQLADEPRKQMDITL